MFCFIDFKSVPKQFYRHPRASDWLTGYLIMHKFKTFLFFTTNFIFLALIMSRALNASVSATPICQRSLDSVPSP